MNKHDRINTIIVAVVAGTLAGFILSMLMGVFGVGTIKEVPSWLQGVSGMVATLVSVFAVYLVAQTLKATRQTLEATRWMAEEQSRIGDAQTRAWVFIDRWKLIDDDEIEMVITNFGNTPAKKFKLDCSFKQYDVGEEPRYDEPIEVECLFATKQNILAPRQSIEVSLPFYNGEVSVYPTYIDVSFSYRTVMSEETIEEMACFTIMTNEVGEITASASL